MAGEDESFEIDDVAEAHTLCEDYRYVCGYGWVAKAPPPLRTKIDLTVADPRKT